MRILEGIKNAAKHPPPQPDPIAATQNVQTTSSPQLPPIHIQNHQANKLHQQQILLQQKARLQAIQMQPQPNRRVVPHAFAIFDFVSKESTDLNLKKGELVVLKRKVDSNWYYGESNAREGMVPSNFIQVMVPLPVPQCTALYDFKMGPQEEEGCLTFDKGTIIKVLRRVDQNWVEGRIGTNIGIFPIAFVEMNPLAKKLMESNIETVKPPSNEPRKLPNLPEEPSQSSSSSNSSSNPTSPQNRAFSGVKYRDYKDKRLSLNSNISTRVPNVAIVQHSNRHSAEILSAPDVSMPLVSSTTEKQRVNVLKTSGQQNVPLPWGYLALYPYKPKKPDELELKKGCVYIVTERCLDGWFKGKNWRDKTGVFPGNYVTALRSRDQQQLIHQGNITQNNIITSSGDTSSTSSAVPELPPRSAGTTSLLDSIFHRKPSESQAQQQNNSTAVNLMKRLNIMKRSKSPIQGNPNPAFEDSTVVATPAVVTTSPPIKQVAHVRSGSCPSQLLQNVPVDVGGTSTTGCGTLFGFGSQRHRPQKEKVSVLTVRQQMDNHLNHRKSLSMDQNVALQKPSNTSPSAGNRHSASGQPVAQMREK